MRALSANLRLGDRSKSQLVVKMAASKCITDRRPTFITLLDTYPLSIGDEAPDAYIVPRMQTPLAAQSHIPPHTACAACITACR